MLIDVLVTCIGGYIVFKLEQNDRENRRRDLNFETLKDRVDAIYSVIEKRSN